jgi:hypothetical protein
MSVIGLSGGTALEAKLAEIAKKVSSSGMLRVGFLEDATYPDGTPVAYVGAVQEYGDPSHNIPSRSYFRSMIAGKKAAWGVALGKIVVSTDYDVDQTLGQMGEGIKGQLQQSIIETNAPALSPITVMLRGMRSHDQSLVVTAKTVGEAARRVAEGKTNYGASTKVLDDTGHMLNSVDYEVNR